MKKRQLRLNYLLIAVSMTLIACGAPSEKTDGVSRGKTDDNGPVILDLYGSCESSCGGASADGNCWCDDECERNNNCCIDKPIFCTKNITCTFAGKTYSSRDVFRLGDGCNTCTCGSNNLVNCTNYACENDFPCKDKVCGAICGSSDTGDKYCQLDGSCEPTKPTNAQCGFETCSGDDECWVERAPGYKDFGFACRERGGIKKCYETCGMVVVGELLGVGCGDLDKTCDIPTEIANSPRVSLIRGPGVCLEQQKPYCPRPQSFTGPCVAQDTCVRDKTSGLECVYPTPCSVPVGDWAPCI